MEEQKISHNTEEDQALVEREYRALVDDYLRSNHRKKVKIIEKAFRFASQAHKGIKRRSGEPYIMHPLAVARIVAREIGLGSTSICSALLHDVVEDTDYTVEDIENLFGKKIATIVDGLTKLAGGVFGEKAASQAENFRKLLITMSDDIRVILIKMADRLHNMRTLGSMPQAKQFKIAGETLYIYAPLANRLGLRAIKTELEDLSFKYEHPDKYEELSKKLENTQHERDRLFALFSEPVREKLESLGFEFQIQSRIKSVYSIWKKMQTKNIPFEEIYDILAIRIVFDSENGKEEKKSCLEIYSAITDVYRPHPDRIRDWISTPKANGYEAFHVTVMGPEGQWIEVQIRSRRMDDIAEKGFAAHWYYKSGGSENPESELEKWLEAIKELLKNPEPDAIDFMDTFKLNLFAEEIFVFTPSGDIRLLPQGATALDFAFSLHSDIGFQCIGAKVNHKLVPLGYTLRSGDQVEVLTSKKQKPNPDWINIVKTARAQGKIKSLFKKEYKALIKKGEHILQEELKKIDKELTDETILAVLDYFNETKKEELYSKIEKGVINVEGLDKTVFKEKEQRSWKTLWIPRFGKSPANKNVSPDQKKTKKVNQKGVVKLTDDRSEVNFLIAECCNPIPGDDILAFVEQDGRMIVHKRQCPVAMKLKSNFGDRIVSAVWETKKMYSFLATIEIKGIDRVGVLGEIVKVISEGHAVNVNKINLESKDGIFGGFITIYVHDVEDVTNLSLNLMKIKGISSVNRVN